jgi:hypothetical protein
MDFSIFEKGINKASSVCANQRGCDDSFLLCKSEIKEIEESLISLKQNNTNKDYDIKIKDLLARLQHARMSINQTEKRLFFAYDALGVSQIDHDMHRFNDISIKANGKIKAVEIVLDLLNIQDKEEFIGGLLSLKKAGLKIEDLVTLTNTKEDKLKALALNNPWMFRCILIGAKSILQKKDSL